MIAYVSSLTNGGCGFVFKVHVHVLKVPTLIKWNLDITTFYNKVSCITNDFLYPSHCKI